MFANEREKTTNEQVTSQVLLLTKIYWIRNASANNNSRSKVHERRTYTKLELIIVVRVTIVNVIRKIIM